MNISKREVQLGIITLVSILVGGTWYYADSKIAEWKGMQLQIEQTKNKIRLDQGAISMQGTWMEELSGLQSNLRVFDLNKNVSPDLQEVLRKISKKYDFQITQFRPQNEKRLGDLFELGINCSWEAELESLVKFLAELQLQGVNYDVRTLTITPAQTQKDKEKLRGTMMIFCAYTRKNIE